MIRFLSALLLLIFGISVGCNSPVKEHDDMSAYQAARDFYKKRDCDSVLDIYEKLIPSLKAPFKDSAMYEFGICLSEARRDAESIAALLYSDESGYRLADAYYNIAVIHYTVSNYDSAEHYLDKTLDIDSVHFRALFLKVELQELIISNEKTI